jgi:hypothetical protein
MTKHGLPILERLALHYTPDPKTGCWVWFGALAGQGRPCTYYNGKNYRVSRLMYKRSKGHIPKKKEVCHTCDNPLCVNPEHLFVGTHLQNMQQAAQRKRFPCRKGESSTRAKLTNKQVLAIRRDPRGPVLLASIYNVDRTLIWLIKTRKIWVHI